MNQEGIKQRYKKTRDYQSALFAFFIALINRHGSIEVMKQAGRTLVALPFLQIMQIKLKNDDIIEFHDFVEKRIKEFMKVDLNNNVPMKTATLRMKKNRIGESLNFLHDILMENGYIFEDRVIGGRNNSMCVDVTVSITIRDNYRSKYLNENSPQQNEFYDEDDILKLGEQICELILRRIGIKYSCVFQQNDCEIQSLLLHYEKSEI